MTEDFSTTEEQELYNSVLKLFKVSEEVRGVLRQYGIIDLRRLFLTGMWPPVTANDAGTIEDMETLRRNLSTFRLVVQYHTGSAVWANMVDITRLKREIQRIHNMGPKEPVVGNQSIPAESKIEMTPPITVQGSGEGDGQSHDESSTSEAPPYTLSTDPYLNAYSLLGSSHYYFSQSNNKKRKKSKFNGFTYWKQYISRQQGLEENPFSKPKDLQAQNQDWSLKWKQLDQKERERWRASAKEKNNEIKKETLHRIENNNKR